MLRLAWIGLFAAIGSVAAFAVENRTVAQFPHTAWGAREGAPHGILAITETRDGYLWLGSLDGLFRFDGITFERYEPPTGPKLPGGSVRSLFAHANGDLWIGYFSGAITLLRDGLATNYTQRDGVPEGRVFCFEHDGTGTIWAGTSKGLLRFEANRWNEVGKDWNFPGGFVLALLLDRNGTLWVAGDRTLVYLSRGAKSFQSTSVQITKVAQLVEAPDGKLWMAETPRSVHPMPSGPRPLPLPYKTEIRVGSIGFLFDRDGTLWISAYGDGLVRLLAPERLTGIIDRKNSAVENYTAKNGLSDNHLTSIFEDREGNIWAGTESGLDRFRRTSVVPVFSSVERHDADLQAMNSGDIWIVGPEGMALIHDFRFTPVAYPAGPITAGYRDPMGTNWWVSYDALVRFKGGHFSRFPLPKELEVRFGIPDTNTVNVTMDRFGVFWVCVQGKGLFRRENGEWTRFETPPEISKLRPRTAFTDDLGRVWFGYDGGTILYVDGGKIKIVSTDRDAPVGDVRVIRGSNRQVWIGGLAGLAFYDGQCVRKVVPSDIADFGVISGLVETADGSLWLRDERGIVHIRPEELRLFLDSADYRVRYEIFDVLDGLPGAFRDLGDKEIQDAKGRLWFWTTNGLAWLNPEGISRNTSAPTIAVLSVVADGRRFAVKPDLTLPPRTTNLQIEYTAVNLSTPERLQYRYELKGTDKGWQDAGNRREAFYTRLTPGKHRFQLAARNQGGVWNDAQLEFTIAPAWFQTIWFQAICGCAFLFICWSLYQLRLRQLERQFNLTLEARVHERTRIARELHDTLLQTFSASLLRFQSVLKMLPARPEEARQRIENAIEQASAAIAEGRDAVHELRTSGIGTGDLLQSIRSFLSELISNSAGKSRPEFRVHVEGTPRDLSPMTRDEVYRIAAEALRNAIRHAGARQIEVDIRYDEQYLRLRVRDDGKGVDPDVFEQGHIPGHWGLQGMRERAKLLGGNFELWSEINSGTEVELTVPAVNAYSKPTPRSIFGRIRRN